MTPHEFEQAIRDTGDTLATATAREMELEDSRAILKEEVIRDLVESGAAKSATAAEKMVESVPTYAEHRLRQREAVIAKIRARANYEAAILKGRFAAGMADVL